MKRVWITRAQPGADATAARLRALGHEPVIAPLLAAAPIGEGPIDLSGVAALAFTSALGVAAFAARSKTRALPVFTVGAATAREARESGFSQVNASDGDVAALARLILGRKRSLPGVVLHPGAVELAGDLSGELQAGGMEARRLAIYATRVMDPGADLLATLSGLDIVLVHSAKGGRALAGVIERHPAPALVALGISPAALRPLANAHLAVKLAAPRPTEAALLELIDHRP